MTPAVPPPRKRLGQHFLIDPNITRKIVALAAIRPEETVLEIGPGRGVLTRQLCAAAQRVIALELDPKLGAYLAETLADCRNLDLRLGDALGFSYGTLPQGTVVVANLPYYVSTPLLFTLLEARQRIDRMVLMLQTEVARRLVAKPATSDYGILSVLVQYAAETSFAFQVSASCFRPSPEVGSAVVNLAIRRQSPVQVKDEALFAEVVRAAFAHRRKTLSNSLRDEGLSSEQIAQALVHVKIGPSRRAETLTLEEFVSLANALGQASARA
ncbi:MAG TPA: 16S rRNA (adenine(1518)-N(6)/adenine(1519)-N(6))-dimethyltransferase RsmA [Nitrospiraceae bacterium]|nr:16S rRNA (adenine(1518)-N(6)/adenine(1519)-N(6))-dimethyltransferase RsmA [Nitrospiraceae bacterium]